MKNILIVGLVILFAFMTYNTAEATNRGGFFARIRANNQKQRQVERVVVRQQVNNHHHRNSNRDDFGTFIIERQVNRNYGHGRDVDFIRRVEVKEVPNLRIVEERFIDQYGRLRTVRRLETVENNNRHNNGRGEVRVRVRSSFGY